MFGLSDAECFLLGWAVGATIMFFREKEKADSLGTMLKVLFLKPEAREGIFSKFDKFKEEHGL